MVHASGMCASNRAGEGRPQAACAEQWPADRCDKRLHVAHYNRRQKQPVASARRLAKAGGELLKSPAGDGQEEADAKSP